MARLSKSQEQNSAMVLKALLNAGFSDNQARILAAEIGRENSFDDRYLWGYHRDPAKPITNIGMISWNAGRGEELERRLQAAGLIRNGQIVKGQASLDVMAKYIMDEMRNDSKYAQTKTQFLDNPNVDYATATRVLGKNYIKWRYDDPKYAHGHRNRDEFYQALGGVAPSAGEQVASAMPSGAPSMPYQQVAQQASPVQSDVQDLFKVSNSGLNVLSAIGGLSPITAVTGGMDLFNFISNIQNMYNAQNQQQVSSTTDYSQPLF